MQRHKANRRSLSVVGEPGSAVSTGQGVLRFLLFVLFAFALVPVQIAHAETATSVEAPQEGPETKRITAVFPKLFPPYYLSDKDGQPAGFAIEVLDAVAARAGLEVTYVAMESWEEAILALRSKEGHVIPNMGITDDRKPYMSFTTPMDTFAISAFILKDTSGIKTTDDLSGHVVGVVKTNIAANILNKHEGVTLKVFNAFSEGYLAFIRGEVDAFVYPERVVWKTAAEGGFQDRILAIGPPLHKVDRAIAVRKDLPELRHVLDRELIAFVATDAFEAIYRKWHDAPAEPHLLDPIFWWIAGGGGVLLAAVGYVYLRRNKKYASLIPWREGIDIQHGIRKRFAWLLSLMAMSVAVVAGTAVWTLYMTAIDQERGRLLEMAQSQARLIESIARFNQDYSSNYPGGITEATLLQIREGFSPYSGRIEVTVARQSDDQIEFIIRQKASRSYELAQIPIDSPLAEPMRRALSGVSGTVIGLDYRNEMVLAAHEPISVLDLGIVVKVDLAEIRLPYIHAAMIAVIVALFVVSLGAFVFFRISDPILINIMEQERHYRILVERQDDLICRNLPDTTLLMVNDAYANFVGRGKNGLRGVKFLEFIPENEHQRVTEHLASFTPEQPTARQEHHVIQRDGEERWMQWTNTATFDDDGKVTEFVAVGRDITEQKKNEDIIISFFEQPLNLHLITGFDGIIHRVNEGWSTVLGRRSAELVGRQYFDFIHPDDIEISAAEMAKLQQGITSFYFENRYRHQDGTYRLIAWSAVASVENKLVYATGIDITENRKAEEDRKNLENSLRQSQKMEAVGQLTGGIAHDYNNMLGVIMGNLDLLRHRIGDDEKANKYLNMAYEGTKRGAQVTRKLLNFSRSEPSDLQSTNVNEFVLGMKELIAKSLTPKIAVETHLAEDIWSVMIDPGDFEDALLNLALNARDAMPDGGSLVIETANKTLDEHYVRLNPSASVGDHVAVAVSDTGIGMTQEVVDRVFQPFFTTKEVGKGTGLGLSMVYGFVQRSGGHVKVYSEPGKGTTVRIYLPRAVGGATGSEQNNASLESDLPRGDETILVVDDEEDLLEIAVLLLESLGYKTLRATDAMQALEVLHENKQVDLVFSDVVMPGDMGGYKLAIEILKHHPGIKVLLTSGFTAMREVAVNGDKQLYEALSKTLLDKPYNQSELAFAIRRALEREVST